ncbi:MAG: hypothetical protein GY849_15990 [Deltaproteobacteria bacterium]|nr:hypothetical protein [Deltaproteobacteria bacterium]
MPDLILITGDQAVFDPQFGSATVTVMPGILQGTGRSSLMGKMVCVNGDEQLVAVPGCSYVQGSFVGGTGTLRIQALGPDQRAFKTYSGKKPVLLKGSVFQALFMVSSPAIESASGTPDPNTQYPGTGRFVTTNAKFKGT